RACSRGTHSRKSRRVICGRFSTTIALRPRRSVMRKASGGRARKRASTLRCCHGRCCAGDGYYNGHMTTVTVTQAKNNLLELLREAEQTGQSFQITRKGRPAGVLVSADEWESLIETVDILSDGKAMQK